MFTHWSILKQNFILNCEFTKLLAIITDKNTYNNYWIKTDEIETKVLKTFKGANNKVLSLWRVLLQYWALSFSLVNIWGSFGGVYY
jgi:hypothetical protein